MPSRLQKARPFRKSTQLSSASNTANETNTASTYLYAASDHTSKPKPSPALNGAMNPVRSNGASHNSTNNYHITSTIRTVRSFDASSSDTSSSEAPSARNSGFASSLNSNISGVSYTSQIQQAPSPSFPSSGSKPSNPTSERSHNVGLQMSSSDATLKGRENGTDHSLLLQVPDSSMGDEHASGREGSPQWDGAVGKAGLGKTGRVINKLVSDNEVLKRDLKIERLKAEESKQGAKLVEDKMERMISDYESRLLEANVTKTLLSRKERQVEHLQSSVELERKRTADAQERERTWRVEMENTRRDTKVQVETANSHAALMESRYNAISSHWKDQGQEVKRAVTTMNGRIKALVDERLKDDDKINVLRDLCDQQDGNIRDLRRQRDEISQKFEAYKREQEAALRGIKENARKREEEQLMMIEETKQVLGKLKWALNVKQNVKGAE
ncbi:hypothetical protein E0Z10_g1108 [Xylaria hypoxylon]|uniref:SWI5-dependent HO expression protein 3 n=1 Tax=Xylaria hypoxylon TaxID=37992 RepID=A0A4Z0Z7W9_9PEZI|nr:hypothetical protein E0Z10_g1108 [Xylaria hypoxylon]